MAANIERSTQLAFTRKHGVAISKLSGVDMNSYLIALASYIPSKQISHISNKEDDIIVYFANDNWADMAVTKGIDIDGRHLDVRPVSSTKVVISNVPPEISDSYLQDLLKKIGPLAGPIINLQAELSGEFSHLLSFQRRAYFDFCDDASVERIPKTIKTTVDGVRYVFDIEINMKCFHCKETGHLKKNCPKSLFPMTITIKEEIDSNEENEVSIVTEVRQPIAEVDIETIAEEQVLQQSDAEHEVSATSDSNKHTHMALFTKSSGRTKSRAVAQYNDDDDDIDLNKFHQSSSKLRRPKKHSIKRKCSDSQHSSNKKKDKLQTTLDKIEVTWSKIGTKHGKEKNQPEYSQIEETGIEIPPNQSAQNLHEIESNSKEAVEISYPQLSGEASTSFMNPETPFGPLESDLTIVDEPDEYPQLQNVIRQAQKVNELLNIKLLTSESFQGECLYVSKKCRKAVVHDAFSSSPPSYFQETDKLPEQQEHMHKRSSSNNNLSNNLSQCDTVDAHCPTSPVGNFTPSEKIQSFVTLQEKHYECTSTSRSTEDSHDCSLPSLADPSSCWPDSMLKSAEKRKHECRQRSQKNCGLCLYDDMLKLS